MEYIKCFHLLTCADELDRFAHNSLDREGCTTTGVTIHLCEDNSVKVESVVECLGCFYSVLTCHRIDYEESLGRLEGILES